MATKALLGRLAFRAVSVPLPAATKITIRYGKDIGTCAGHTSARHFARNYLPVLLYSNPTLEAAVEKREEHNDAPCVILTRSDGTELVISTRDLAEEAADADAAAAAATTASGSAGSVTPPASALVDAAIFKALTGRELVLRDDWALGAGQSRASKAAKAAADAAASAPGGDSEGAGADAAATAPAAGAAVGGKSKGGRPPTVGGGVKGGKPGR